MEFNTMSDEQIVQALATSLEDMRVVKQISSETMAKKGGHNSQTYSNFINRGTDIRIKTLIQMFRGVGELDKLQKAFEYKKPFSPTGKYNNLPTRVRKKKESKGFIEWGEDK